MKAAIKNTTKIFIAFIIFQLGGCFSIPEQVPPKGVYLVTSLDGRPLIEVQFSTPESCAADLNQTLKTEGRKMEKSRTTLECKEKSGGDYFSYSTTIKNNITGENHPARFHSEFACELFSIEFSSKFNKYFTFGCKK